jgi:ribose transport system ATP-binding protein
MLSMSGITKQFGGVAGLHDVHLDLARGEAHALVGENGAGKSTLVKIMTGAYRMDSGEIRLEGQRVDFRSPRDAQAAGVVAVHQEVHLLSHRSIAENILLGREPRRWGLVDWKATYEQAADVLARLGLQLDPRRIVSTLDIANQQMVAIARGASMSSRVLVLDEPTSSLSDREVRVLYDLIARLKQAGTTIVYISHRFDELYTICERVTVLRDGRYIATRTLADLPRLELICLMLGKNPEELAATEQQRPPRRTHEPLLSATDLTRGTHLRNVSLQVGRGEVVGMAGLLGSGRTETARAIFGLDAVESGHVEVGGKPIAAGSVAAAMESGLAFLTEDRKGEGIIPDLSIRDNLTLAALPAFARLGIVSRARQQEVVDRLMRRLRIKATGSEQKISELSGGNQQKVLLARWLCRDPQVLLLDEPTRGVDIGAKGEIASLIRELADEGRGVLLISSELDELCAAAERIVVMRDGAVVGELPAASTPDDVVAAMAGPSA